MHFKFIFSVCCLLGVSAFALFLPLSLERSCPKVAHQALASAICYVNQLPCVGVVVKLVEQSPYRVKCDRRLEPSVAGLTTGNVFYPRFKIELDMDKFLIGQNQTAVYNAWHNVLLHELGHALGLPHQETSSSVMRTVQSLQGPKKLWMDETDASRLRLMHGDGGYGCYIG